MNVEYFKKLITQDLSQPAQIELLRLLSLNRLTSQDLTDIVNLAITKAVLYETPDDHTIDLVGTGGDGLNTFNITTTASFVVAGAGIKVAKQGNVGISSRSGSFDLLAALNVQLPHSQSEAKAQLARANLTFLFAKNHHPIFTKIYAARKQLAKEGVITVFNVLGPLLNPMRVKRQVLGVFRPELIKPYIETLKATGSTKAMVVHGAGLDEFSLSGENQMAILEQGKIRYATLCAADIGLQSCQLNDIKGGSPEANKNITMAILSGELQGPMRDIVVLNAAAGIMVAKDSGLDFAVAIELAKKSIDSGSALKSLTKLC